MVLAVVLSLALIQAVVMCLEPVWPLVRASQLRARSGTRPRDPDCKRNSKSKRPDSGQGPAWETRAARAEPNCQSLTLCPAQMAVGRLRTWRCGRRPCQAMQRQAHAAYMAGMHRRNTQTGRGELACTGLHPTAGAAEGMVGASASGWEW